MKKIQKSFLLTLITLGLFGCNRITNSSQSSTGSSTPTSEKESSNSPSISTPSSTPSSTTTTSTPISSPSSTTSSSTSSTPSSTIPEAFNSDWQSDVKEEMTRHLGIVLPYYPMGKSSELMGGWERGTTDLGSYHLTGGADFDASLLTPAKTVFENAGFTVTIENEVLTAKHTTPNLTVKIYGEAIASSDDETKKVNLSADRVETYDESVSLTTEWDEDVQSVLDRYYTDPDNKVPFLYLGTYSNYATYFYDEEKELEIFGGRFDDRITTIAITKLESLNYEVTKNGDSGFTAVQKGEGGKYTLSLIKRTIRLDDGTTPAVAVLRIKYVSSVDPTPTEGQWSEDIKEAFADKLNNHSVPYFDIGTNAPSYTASAENSSVTIQGGIVGDDSVFTNAKTIFGKDSSDWKICSDNAQLLSFLRKFSDGYLYVAIEKDSRGVITVNAVLTVPYTTAGSSYSEDFTKKANEVFDNHASEFPYIYLGATQTFEWLEGYNTENDDNVECRIKGGKFSEGMIDNIISKLDSFWTYTVDSSFYGRTLKAEKTLADKCKLTIEMKAAYGNSSLLFGFTQGFNYTGEGTWSNEILERMDNKLSGYHLPYVYLGTDNPTLDSLNMEIVGGNWNDQILTTAKTDLKKAEGFTIEDSNFEAFDDELDLSVTNEKGDKLTVEITKNGDGKIALTASFVRAYILPDEADRHWSEALQNKMKANYGEVLPYIYLNSDKIEYGDNSEVNNGFIIKGGSWDDKVLDFAQTSFDAATGWTSSIDKDENNSVSFLSYKVLTDGKVIRVAIKSYNGVLTYYVFLDEAVTPTANSWSDSLKEKTKSYMPIDKIPYFEMGDTNFSVSTKTDRYYTGKKYLNISLSSDGNWKSGYVYNAYKVLTDAGFKATFLTFTSYMNTSGPRMMASKTFDDGSYVSLQLNPTRGNKNFLSVFYSAPYDKSTSTATDWSNSIKSNISQYANGLELPYVYLGTDNVAFDVVQDDSGNVTGIRLIGGSSWNDQMQTDFQNAFAEAGWTKRLSGRLYRKTFTINGKSKLANATIDTISNDYYPTRAYVLSIDFQ